MLFAGTQDLQAIAKVYKSNGVEGEVILNFTQYSPQDLNLEVPIFIYFDGLSVPFFIQNLQIKANKAYVHFVGIDDLASADELQGKLVYMRRDDLQQYMEEDENYLYNLIGFTLIDKTSDKELNITGIEEIPNNLCLYVEYQNQEVLIPFNEDFIQYFEPKAKKIIVNLPEGILSF